MSNLVRGQPFYGRVGDFEKNMLQANMREKNIPAQDHRPKKKFTHVQWAGKKSWQDVPCADTVNFCISRLLTDFSIWTWVFIKKRYS